MLSLEEKKEHIVMYYKQSYDLDIAMLKVGLSKEEMQELKRDESFMYRIHFQDALLREDIISTMISNLNSEDPKLAQKAAIDLGNILWKERFKDNKTKEETIVPDKIVLKGKA